MLMNTKTWNSKNLGAMNTRNGFVVLPTHKAVRCISVCGMIWKNLQVGISNRFSDEYIQRHIIILV